MRDIVTLLRRREPVPSRDLKLIDGIAVHHSGDEGTPRGWAEYHTTPYADGGPYWNETLETTARSIGYHCAVMRDGTVFKTAYDSDRTPGVAHHNEHLIHIVLQGNLAKQPPTEEQFRSLLLAIKKYKHAYGIVVPNIRTHGEWQTDPAWATACPGIQYLGALVRGAFVLPERS